MLKILKSSLFNLDLGIRMTHGWLSLCYQIPRAVGPNGALGLELEFSGASDKRNPGPLQVYSYTTQTANTGEEASTRVCKADELLLDDTAPSADSLSCPDLQSDL